MKTIRIKPGAGRRVPMPAGYGLPHGADLPADGLDVPLTALIRKMLLDRDVVEAAPAAPPASQPDAPAAPALSEAAQKLADQLAASNARSAADAAQDREAAGGNPAPHDDAQHEETAS